jgi:mono/diheme cytochrome c family protein
LETTMTRPNSFITLLAWVSFTALVLCGVAATATAQDRAMGQRIATEWCSACHAIDGVRRANDTAPAFSTIANQPDLAASFLRAWLIDPHPPMPKLDLPRIDIDDLIAYILALRASR